MRISILALCTVACVPVLESPAGGLGATWEPPDNSWPLSAPPDDLVGEGFYVGQTAPDFLLVDQHGDEVSLWQFYGSVVALDISTMWCGPCQALAQGVEETWLGWREAGFVYVTVLPEDQEGRPTDLDDVRRWAEEFGITAPIVADPGEAYSRDAVTADVYPVVLVLDRELTVGRRLAQPTDENLRAALEELL